MRGYRGKASRTSLTGQTACLRPTLNSCATWRPRASPTERLFSGRRIDDAADLADLVCRKAAALCVLANDVLVGCAVDAVDLVVRDVAVNPLNFGPQLAKHGTAGLRRALQVA